MIGKARLTTTARKTNHTTRYPAPDGGVDTRAAVGKSELSTCVYAYNLVPFEYGMVVRRGYREWQIGVDNGGLISINTMIPFDGVDVLGSGDKLFAVSNEGIWDVSLVGAAPILKMAFNNISAQAGFGPFTHYIDDSGQDLLFYADSLNGLFTYDPILDTWAQAAGITGPAVENIRFIVSHKQRLWMIEETSTKAWYLPIGSKSGQATEFFFGSKFKHGGSLEGLFNWSVDGGEGLDDYLVAVSHAGDVIPYKGEDPSSADSWSQVGTYFIGEVPEGPFFAIEQGGELMLLASFGLVAMSDLLQGVDSASLQSNAKNSGMALKIASLLRREMQETISEPGWSIQLIPSEGGMLITSPTVNNKAPIQYYYNMAAQGWGLWRDAPIRCATTWQNAVVFGTEDGRVMRMDVTVDEQTLAPPAQGLNGRDIDFSILSSFTSLGMDGLYKKVTLIRPDFLADLAPSYSNLARYDFDLRELIHTDKGASPLYAAATWDVSAWDNAVWGGSQLVPNTFVGGSWGYGRYVAIATRGSTRTTTRLVGWDLTFSGGGSLI